MSDDSASGGAALGVLRSQAEHRALLVRRHAQEGHVVAAVLCAQWCTTCRDFLPMLETLARRYPAISWLWIDIEDDAAWVGDVDVETFATLAIYIDATLAHFGPVLPSATLVERLVADATPGTVADAHPDIASLVRALLAG